MKIETRDLDLHVDPLRRRLMFGLPSGLVLASPLALLGCGGGGDGGNDDGAAGSSVDLHDAGRAFVGDGSLDNVTVSVGLPAGVSVPGGALAAHTVIGGFGVFSAGSASLPLAFGGVQLVTVYTSDGLPLLFGWLDATLTTLDTRSTATALIASAIGAPMLDADLGRQWIVEIGASPAAATFADAIATALAADIYAVASFNPAIQAGLKTAVRTLLAANGMTVAAAPGRPRAQGVTINPGVAKSGVEPVHAETLNTVYLQNEKLRRAYYAIRRESSVTAAGETVKDPARTLVASGDIPMLPAFSSAGGIITAVTTAVYADDQTGLAFSKTPETLLPLEPADAKSTTYSVIVLTAGNEKLGFDPVEASKRITVAELEKIEIGLFSTQHLGLQTLMLDFLVPMALGWIGGKIGEAGSSLGPREFKQKLQVALLGQLFSVLTTTIPTVVAKLKDAKTYPDYGIVGALGDIVTNHLVVFIDVEVPGRATPVTVPALSKFSIGLVTLLLKFLAYEKMNVADGEKLLTFLEGSGDTDKVDTRYTWVTGTAGGKEKRVDFDITGLEHAGLGVALKALGTVDSGLSWLNQSRVAIDIGTSKLYETWDLTVTQAKVTLTPASLSLVPGTPLYTLKADVVDNDNDYGIEKGSIVFDWECTGQWGSLYSPLDTALAQPNRFTTSKNYPTVNFQTNGKEPDPDKPDTVTVTAFFEPIGSGGTRQPLGSATSTLKGKRAFTLKVTPPSAELPANASMNVSVRVVEPLPVGASVRYEWSLASGAGTLSTPPADASLATSYVAYQAPATDTTAVVQVRAIVTTAAGLALPTDPVTASLAVKAALKTVNVEGSWVYEPGTKPLAAPSCFFDGQGKEACHLGYLDDWVVYQIPKVAGALSYDIRLLDAQGGVRVRYGYPTGSYAGNVSDAGGMLRIRYWAADGPYGSYDGVSNYPETEANAMAYLLSRVASDGPRIVATVTLAP